MGLFDRIIAESTDEELRKPAKLVTAAAQPASTSPQGSAQGSAQKPKRANMSGWSGGERETRYSLANKRDWGRGPVRDSPDLQRILLLPRRPPVDLGGRDEKGVVQPPSARAVALIEMMTEQLGRGPRKCNCKFNHHLDRLNGAQAWTLYEAPLAGGMLGSLGVGSGKTAIDVLISMVMPDCSRAVLLIPPGLKQQLWDEYEALSEHFNVPSIVFDDQTHQRGRIVKGRPVVHVLPYSKLSRPESTDILRQLDPDLIIADECFPAGTQVLTDSGLEDIERVQTGRTVLSYNPTSATFEWKSVLHRFERPKSTRRMVRVHHASGSFVCTDNHKIWTEGGGYVEAGGLAKGDRLRVVWQGDVATAVHVGQAILLEEVQRFGQARQTCASEEKGRVRQCDVRNLQQELRADDKEASTDVFASLCGSLKGQDQGELRRVRATDDGAAHEVLFDGMRCERSSEAKAPRATCTEQQACCAGPVLELRRESVALESRQEGSDEVLFSPLLCDVQTQRGVGEAEAFSSTYNHYQNLCEVRQGVQASFEGQDEQQDSVLFNSLLSGIRVGEGSCCNSRGVSTGRCCANAQKQSVVSTRSAGKNVRSAEGQDLFGAWWERQADRAAVGVERAAQIAHGVGDSYSGCERAFPFSASSVQGGFGGPERQPGNRDRWQLAQDQEVEVLGSPEGIRSFVSRVDRVEVLERGSYVRGESGSRDDLLYDLEVEGNHNYVAEGVLVSNCHKLCDMKTSTVARFLRFLISKPDTRFCGWSGTITKKSIKNYAHLLAIALGEEGSPLPVKPQVVEEWASAIDPSDSPADMGALRALCASPEEGLYGGYHRRLVETLGVVTTRASAVDASINFYERKPHLPEKLKTLLDWVRTEDKRPDGEEFVDEFETAKCVSEVACGFYYRWRFPKGTNPKDIDRWFAARQAWNREQREMLSNPKEHLDSQKLLYNAAERYHNRYKGDLPVWNSQTWFEWSQVKDTIKHRLEAVWIDDYLAEDCAAWAEKHKGIIWYGHGALGQRIAELAKLPMHGGGPGAEARILAEKGDRSLVVSIKAHGTGRNGLQRLFHEQLFANFPASGDLAEQLLGRLHRLGQNSDEVNSWVYRHVHEMARNVDRAILQAKYIQGTLGSRQKLLAANYAFDVDVEAVNSTEYEDDFEDEAA